MSKRVLTEETATDGARNGLNGWISCFDQARLAGSVLASGVDDVGSIQGNPRQEHAYKMGKNV